MLRPVLSLVLPITCRGNGRTRDGGPMLSIIGQKAFEKINSATTSKKPIPRG